MQDGRSFTDYRSRCAALESNMSTNDYRKYLTENAVGIMDQMAARARGVVPQPCYLKSESGTMVPEMSYVQCNAKTCDFLPGHPDGHGTGRKYFS